MKFASLMLASAVLVAAPAFAADDTAVATLRVQAGDVKASAGGDFAPANTGARLETGNRLMLGEGATATLQYTNGCQMQFNQPGVYTVAPVCTAGAKRTGTDWAGAGAIAAGAAVGAALLENMDKVPGPPASR